jgi:hypothetical protein
VVGAYIGHALGLMLGMISSGMSIKGLRSLKNVEVIKEKDI